jgi:hypothetical protein
MSWISKLPPDGFMDTIINEKVTRRKKVKKKGH